MLQKTVSTEDDCTLWLGMQKVVDCEENRSSWVSNCNDSNIPLPDCVILSEE